MVTAWGFQSPYHKAIRDSKDILLSHHMVFLNPKIQIICAMMQKQELTRMKNERCKEHSQLNNDEVRYLMNCKASFFITQTINMEMDNLPLSLMILPYT